MIVGLSFQIIEDGLYVFQQIFKSKADGFATLIERMLHAGGTHWAFSLAFAVGLVALVSKIVACRKTRTFLDADGCLSTLFLEYSIQRRTNI